jgi:hypothetical protein
MSFRSRWSRRLSREIRDGTIHCCDHFGLSLPGPECEFADNRFGIHELEQAAMRRAGMYARMDFTSDLRKDTRQDLFVLPIRRPGSFSRRYEERRSASNRARRLDRTLLSGQPSQHMTDLGKDVAGP